MEPLDPSLRSRELPIRTLNGWFMLLVNIGLCGESEVTPVVNTGTLYG